MTRRTPIPIRLAMGNPSKRPMPNNAASPPAASRLTPPAWLSVEARRAWRRVARPLANAGLLSVVDLPLLGCLADAIGDFEAACRLLADQGVDDATVTPGGNTILERIAARKTRARDSIAKLAGMFGASPTSRAGLEIVLASALERPPTRPKSAKSGVDYFARPPGDVNRFFPK